MSKPGCANNRRVKEATPCVSAEPSPWPGRTRPDQSTLSVMKRPPGPILRPLSFPIGLLLITIPIPAIVFNQIAFPLQLLASRFGEAALGVAGVPVLREGNLLVLANITLEVAEACSGMRSLMSLLTVGILIGYFGDRRSSMRIRTACASRSSDETARSCRCRGTRRLLKSNAG